MTILGIDPALRSTGYGVIQALEGGRLRELTHGVIRTPTKAPLSETLVAIHAGIAQVIAETRPDVASVEGIIYVQNTRTAISMGAARGAALLAIAQAGLDVYEYAPKRIKAAATGVGSAQKAQVAFMMRALLGLTSNPPPDAADALAAAVTHAQQNRQISAARRV